MNKVFRNLPFPVKLMLIGFIPLLFLIYFAFQILSEKRTRIQIVNNVVNDINLTAATMDLSEHLLTERQQSLMYLAGKSTLAELLVQHNRANESQATVQRLAGENFEKYYSYSLLRTIPDLRQRIIKKSVSPDEVISIYSPALFRLHSLNFVSVNNIPYLSQIDKDLLGQQIMAQVLNYWGVTRATVYFTSLKAEPTEKDFNDINHSYNLTFSLWEEFLAKATPEATATFLKLTETEESKYLNAELLHLSTERRYSENFESEIWWKHAESITEKFTAVQKTQLAQTKERTLEISKNEEESLYLTILGLAAAILLVIFIIFYCIRSLTLLLDEIRTAAEEISLGMVDIKLNITSKDAIGSLARSIRTIEVNNSELALAADRIGKGDFSARIIPRSASDVLGNAVLRMRDDLQQFSQENENKLWIQGGLNRINESVRGEKNLEELSNGVLTTLIKYLDGSVGLLYNNNYENLELITGYAIPNNNLTPQRISFGETLIGEAINEQKIKYLRDVPDDFIKVSTAIGESIPKHLLIIPLVQNNVVEGVIEIGALKPFNELSMQFLEQASVSIAIAMQSVKSRAKLQELFEETQSQSEELQSQHRELENINTELEAQSQRLQSSEEILRVQQEELQTANQELEERSRLLEEKNRIILERNAEIQSKAEELELSSKYKSEFLANMSHELRTPLNSILLLSRLMAENNDKNLTKEQVQSAKVIQSSGKGLLNLIDEILDVSRIEAGKMELEYAELPLDKLVKGLESLFAPVAMEKGLELSFHIQPDCPKFIETDQQRLEQILKNLISNALKFTSSGYVKVFASISPDEGDKIQFSVKDSGPGIPAEKHKLIFEAFQQADGSTKRKYGGTGLGLSISRQLARLLGGDISVSSAPGEGSEFIVSLPLSREYFIADTEVRAEEVVSLHAESNQPKQKRFVLDVIPEDVEDDRNNIQEGDHVVLIIEDDTTFANALLSFSHQKGYKGIICVRGDMAIQLALSYKPTAILLDILLPVKDGWEIMEELKSNPKLRHIPVHIMSSLEVKKESLTKGAIDFINKPFAIEQLQDVFNKFEQALTQGPKKVLIIEENPKHAKALAYFLKTFNITALVSENIDSAVNALQNTEINCVILDMGEPEESDFETLETVKMNPGLEKLPIIIFTGKRLSKAEETKIKRYADSIVVKTAHSYQRILDEVSLFFHLIKDNLKPENVAGKLGAMSEVLKDKTVLIADDDIRNIYSLTRSLEQHKMKIISAIDGKDALKQLEEHPEVDIVLMDMMMPEMDGYDATRRIKEQNRYKHLPVLAITAKNMAGDRQKCIEAGASDYISKPVDIDQLVSLMRVWLYDKFTAL